jgi:sec-independent protein translocase protein TatA
MPVVIASPFAGADWLLILVIGFFLFVVFGKRLPDVGRSLGKGIMEFKKGMKGLEDDAGEVYSAPTGGQQPQALQPEAARPPQRITAAAPKFDEQPNPANANPQAPPKI